MPLEALSLVAAFVVGTALGFFYFGSLWLTVRQVPRTRHPVAVVFGSLLGRAAVVFSVFYFVMDGRWERLIVCLAGFILIRQVMLRVVGDRSAQQKAQGGRPPV